MPPPTFSEVHQMLKSRRMAWTLATIISAVCFTGMAAIAADNSPKIAVVDLAKVYKDAPRVKQYMEELDGFRAQLGQKLEIRSQNMMLDENEIKELIDLKLKATATDKDKARISELMDIERKRDEELKQLQATKDLSEPQKARQTELQKLQANSKTTGESLEKDYNANLQSKIQELDEKAKVDMQEAINKVAGEKAYTLIFDKSAVMFGGTDISDQVIAKLDRKIQ